MASLNKFAAYQEAARLAKEAARWVAHNGAQGRHYGGNQDILHLSPAHCTIKLVIAGQYSEGGQNYWDSPLSFNCALISVIAEQFASLSKAALAKLETAEAEALVAAKEEVEEANRAIEEATTRLSTLTPAS